MAKLTKTEKVLKHLEQYNKITSWEAIQLYGATRLSAIIFNLKKKGYNIISKRKSFIDRYGDKSQFAVYYLDINKSMN